MGRRVKRESGKKQEWEEGREREREEKVEEGHFSR